MSEAILDLIRDGACPRMDSAETVKPTELGKEVLDLVSGGEFPEYDPDG